MKKKATVISAIVIIILFIGGGWIFYHNQQTILDQFASKHFETYDARQCDDVMANHLGMTMFLDLDKNTGRLQAFNPVYKNGASDTYKYIKPNTSTAKAIYKVFGHDSYNPDDYNNKTNSESLGRVHVTMQGKKKWTLHSRKLTLTFHKTSDGHWATSDGTLWFKSKAQKD